MREAVTHRGEAANGMVAAMALVLDRDQATFIDAIARMSQKGRPVFKAEGKSTIVQGFGSPTRVNATLESSRQTWAMTYQPASEVLAPNLPPVSEDARILSVALHLIQYSRFPAKICVAIATFATADDAPPSSAFADHVRHGLQELLCNLGGRTPTTGAAGPATVAITHQLVTPPDLQRLIKEAAAYSRRIQTKASLIELVSASLADFFPKGFLDAEDPLRTAYVWRRQQVAIVGSSEGLALRPTRHPLNLVFSFRAHNDPRCSPKRPGASDLITGELGGWIISNALADWTDEAMRSIEEEKAGLLSLEETERDSGRHLRLRIRWLRQARMQLTSLRLDMTRIQEAALPGRPLEEDFGPLGIETYCIPFSPSTLRRDVAPRIQPFHRALEMALHEPFQSLRDDINLYLDHLQSLEGLVQAEVTERLNARVAKLTIANLLLAGATFLVAFVDLATR